MLERCDHNRFANEQQQRYVEQRLRELNAFEVRASGLANPFFNTATASARVATQGTFDMNSLFKPAEITTAKLKMALMGFQGSGKTFTATDTAIGLVLTMKKLGLPEGDLPIAFADTEKGARWVLPKVQEAGLKMVTARTRAFSDLVGLVGQAEGNASVLLVDSLTHFWTELCDTYCARKAAQYKTPTYRLQFQDWAFLKGEWRKFTDRFVNSNLHIIVCGRAGFEYDFIEDEDTHKKQLEKTGIKFKAEGEMGYEPDLLVLMERKMNMATKADEHVAHVVKDRSTLLDGLEIVDPSFKDFRPHIDCLNLAGVQLDLERGVDITRTSAASIPSDAPRDNKGLMRKILVDEINDLLMRHDAAGTAKDAQKKRSDLLQKHFDTVSKTMIEELMPQSDLRAGYDAMHIELTGEPSRYGSAIARDAESLDMNDGLPAGMAPLKDITLSAEALATPLVKAALQDAAAGPEDDGIPSYLKRQTEPAITPLAPAEPEIDEPKFLAEVTKALEDCLDFVSFGHAQQTLLNPNRSKVSAPTWEKASRLMRKAIKRLTEVEVPGAVMASAAE